MAWTVILEDENGNLISQLQKEIDIDINITTFKLLKYLDEHGDTTFNCLQMDDLIDDLTLLQSFEYITRVDSIISMAKTCKSTSHSYLKFYGD